MKLLGYIRTRLVEDLGEHDLEEQERALAEFCSGHQHDLIGVAADEGEEPTERLQDALNNPEADGLVITDPLVIGENIDGATRFISQLIKAKKHLYIVYHDKHIDPSSSQAEQELINQSLSLLNHNIT